MTTVDWDTAACATADPEAFFPDPSDRHGIAFAVSYCRRCPVTSECLTESFETDSRYGIWGGLTEDERWRIREQRPAPTRAGVFLPRTRNGVAPCGTTSGYQRHRRDGTTTCPDCRAAMALASRQTAERRRLERTETAS